MKDQYTVADYDTAKEIARNMIHNGYEASIRQQNGRYIVCSSNQSIIRPANWKPVRAGKRKPAKRKTKDLLRPWEKQVLYWICAAALSLIILKIL